MINRAVKDLRESNWNRGWIGIYLSQIAPPNGLPFKLNREDLNKFLSLRNIYIGNGTINKHMRYYCNYDSTLKTYTLKESRHNG